jgi:transposase InsO family protein
MKEQQRVFKVVEMAAVLRVSRSGYYRWRQGPSSRRAVHNEQLWGDIQKVYQKHKRRYGSPRITDELRECGHGCNKKRVARLMREHGLRAIAGRKYKVTTHSGHDEPIAPNLLQQNFQAAVPKAVWVSDITYIWTREGWLYLAAVVDVYNRKVVGWSLSERLTRDFVVAAIRQAVWRERPPKGLIFHSDRGLQYASGDVRNLLACYEFRQSMSGKGNCYDNALMESFYHTLKIELVYQEDYATRSQARQSIFEYIELYYNRQRKHSALGYLTPVQFGQIKKVT